MRLFEVKNDIAKIIYNPAENHLLPSDFVLIEDANQKLIAQIIDISTTENTNNNLADVRLSLSIDNDDNLSYYNGYIPIKSARIQYINSEEIIELLQGDEDIYLGNLSNHSECFVKPSLSFINDKVYIQSDRNDKTKIIIQNIIFELKSKQKKVILLDFDGSYVNILNVPRLKISENFKFPLNIDAFNNILEYDIADCPIEDKAVIQSIVLELREYIKTLENKFLPFSSFKNVIDNEYISNPLSGLLLLRNNLRLYEQEGFFAEKKTQFNQINSMLKDQNLLIIDAASIDEKWYKFAIQTIIELINENCYFAFSLNDVLLGKKSIINLYNKANVIPIVSTSYGNEYRQILKSICKNQIFLKPSNIINDEEPYNCLLNKINSDEIILFGESTLYMPIILELKSFNSSTNNEVIQNDIKKDVDKFFYPSKKTKFLKSETYEDKIQSKPDNIIQNKNIIDDDFTESDFEFLEEQSQNQIINEPQKAVEFNKYDVFEPMPDIAEETYENADNSIKEKILEKEIEEQEYKEDQIEKTEMSEDGSDKSINDNTNTENKINDDEEEISSIDEIINDITLKIDENKENNTYETLEEETNNELKNTEADENQDKKDQAEFESTNNEENIEEQVKFEEAPPSVKKDINTNKTSDITVYETDNSADIYVEDIPFKIGDKVYHPKHGNGIVEGFANYSNKILFCQIEFENVGRRILDPRISGIQKIS